MILKRNDLKLRSIVPGDLEKVRLWRNDPFVRAAMFFQEEITAKMQRQWYDNLGSDIYLMIVYREKEIGVINVKDINSVQKSGEAGIFLGEPDYRNTIVPMQAILFLMDVFFDNFHFNTLIAKVRAENEQAIQFNKELGYQYIEQNNSYVLLEVTKSQYIEARKKWARLLEKWEASEYHVSLTDKEQNLFFPSK